jgi:hypothetical protein
MQQRQLRLGDILDDYCPRERRITNHAVVAMVGPDVKQTRCTTCDAEHEYKHGKVPRQRRKPDAPAALYSQVLAGGPKRVTPHDPAEEDSAIDKTETTSEETHDVAAPPPEESAPAAHAKPASDAAADLDADSDEPAAPDAEEGPVHRPLIRATLPRAEGQPPPTRPAPDFTIRHPGGRPNRFRHRAGRGAQQFQGNRSNGNMGGGMPRGGSPRPGGGRPPHGMSSRVARRHGPKRQK